MNIRARERIEQLRAQPGFGPQTVIDDARDALSPLHKHFEWDDTRAAERYRLEIATRLIRVVVKMSVVDAPLTRMSIRQMAPEPMPVMRTQTRPPLDDKALLAACLGELTDLARRYSNVPFISKWLNGFVAVLGKRAVPGDVAEPIAPPRPTLIVDAPVKPRGMVAYPYGIQEPCEASEADIAIWARHNNLSNKLSEINAARLKMGLPPFQPIRWHAAREPLPAPAFGGQDLPQQERARQRAAYNGSLAA